MTVTTVGRHETRGGATLAATWNLNSIRARLPRVVEFLHVHRPDVLLVQETKVTGEQFPHDELVAEGWRAVDHSTGRWAGVAVLVRDDLEIGDITRGLADTPADGEGRWLEVAVGDTTWVTTYVVNGRTVDDPMYEVKLEFLDRMADRLEVLRAAGPVVLGGDMNIIPADVDCYDPAAFRGGTHVTDAERVRLQAMLDLGFVDAFRHRHGPDVVGHTWWDYRAGHFHKGYGLRIDLFLVDERVAGRVTGCGIDRNFRKGTKPSDHAPLLLQLDG